jgi:hypothetical protein
LIATGAAGVSAELQFIVISQVFRVVPISALSALNSGTPAADGGNPRNRSGAEIKRLPTGTRAVEVS